MARKKKQPRMCSNCGANPLPRKGARGKAGAALRAGMCLECWQGIGSVARFLEEAALDLKALTSDLASESGSLVERARRFVFELQGRVAEVKAAIRRMDESVREANAEVRRSTRDVRGLWREVSTAKKDMPAPPRAPRREETEVSDE